MVRQAQVFNSCGSDELSSSRWIDVQNVTFDMRWVSDKLIQTKLAVQQNKTLCVWVVGLIHLKISHHQQVHSQVECCHQKENGQTYQRSGKFVSGR